MSSFFSLVARGDIIRVYAKQQGLTILKWERKETQRLSLLSVVNLVWWHWGFPWLPDGGAGSARQLMLWTIYSIFCSDETLYYRNTTSPVTFIPRKPSTMVHCGSSETSHCSWIVVCVTIFFMFRLDDTHHQEVIFRSIATVGAPRPQLVELRLRVGTQSDKFHIRAAHYATNLVTWLLQSVHLRRPHALTS